LRRFLHQLAYGAKVAEIIRLLEDRATRHPDAPIGGRLMDAPERDISVDVSVVMDKFLDANRQA
jgi:hypothetical protein